MSDNVFIDILGGYAYQEFNRQTSNMRGTGFGTINSQELYLRNLNFATAFPVDDNFSTFDRKIKLQSYFGRVNATLFDKLLLTATLRVDGSSKFGDDNQYAAFPSVAVAYQLDEEAFVPDLFSSLKLRVGYGITGNQEFPTSASFGGLNFVDNNLQETASNPDLSWESTSQINVGIDYGFAKGRITGSIDYFRKETQDFVFPTEYPQPAPLGFVFRNLDDVKIINSGIEFSILTNVIDKDDFFLDIGLNFSYLNNKIQNITSRFPSGLITGELNGQGLSNQRGQIFFDDQELFAYYLAVFEGFDDQGFAQYADLNGDCRKFCK